MIGKILGNRYELLEKIGQGGMGNVYKAYCHKLDRIVAIKILKAEYNDDNNFIRKFKRESLAAASISHPNIVNIYDVGSEEIENEKVHYIVMEYIDGKTLKEVIKEEGHLEEKVALEYCMQIAEALKVAHSKGIVHRDIKSQNIMITRDERVKVTDFGIARVADNSTVTATNAIMGSVHYFSPEQARGVKVDNRSDIYSLGIVFYEMLTGELPFDADNPVSVALMQVQSNMPKPSSKVANISQASDVICLKMTMKDPQDRYSDVYKLIRDIKNVLLGRAQNINLENDIYKGDTELRKDYSPKNKKVVRRSSNVKKEKEAKKSMAPIVLGVICAILLLASIGYGMKYISRNKSDSSQAQKQEVLVPTVEGLTSDKAKAAIEAAGFVMNIIDNVEEADKKDKEVVKQDPKAGEKLEEGSTINVVVNIVQDSVKVPDLVSSTLEEAQKLVSDAGLEINGMETAFSDDVEADKIISQTPDAGDMVDKNTKIKIIISKGKEDKSTKIPSVKGVSQISAEKTLKDAGFEVDVEYIYANNVEDGEVSYYEPTGIAEKGTTVKIYVRDKSISQNEDNSQSNSSNSSKEERNLPSELVFKLPKDNEKHQVTVYRHTSSGSEYKIYDYSKSDSEGDVIIPLEYVSNGDKFEVFLDGLSYKIINID